MRPYAALLALALLAAACGDTGAVDTMPSLDESTSETLTLTAAPADQPEQQGPQQPLPESDYPDVVVADLAGGEVNLKELAFEQKPVLLWFWAPH